MSDQHMSDQHMSNEHMSGQGVRLVVDGDRCIGSGMCEMLEEATFLIDEDTNVASVVGAGTVASDRAAVVIDRCPSGAISIAAADSTAADGDEE